MKQTFWEKFKEWWKKQNTVPVKNKKHISRAKQVRDEAERIKKEAMSSGTPHLISYLYHENIHYYPHWIKNVNNREFLPSIITEAKEIKLKNGEGTQIRLNGKEYIFYYKKNYYEGLNSADLELWLNNRRIIAINEEIIDNKWSTNYAPFSVDAFVDGDWVKDFTLLAKEIEKLKKERERKEFENPKEIAKLKKDFDIK